MRPAALATLLLLAACGGRDMDDQPKYEAYETATLFPDGSAMQTPVPGTIARGEFAWRAALDTRPPLTQALLQRGRERFEVFCTPCHGLAGDGDGMVVQRGFPPPPSFHNERLRAVSTEHFVDVITNGYGVMYAYAERVPPPDRWAIAAYIRALQLSQHADASSLPQDVAQQLGGRP